MNTDYKKFAFYLILGLSIVYLYTAYINLNPNPLEYAEGARAIVVVLGLASLIISFIGSSDVD